MKFLKTFEQSSMVNVVDHFKSQIDWNFYNYLLDLTSELSDKGFTVKIRILYTSSIGSNVSQDIFQSFNGEETWLVSTLNRRTVDDILNDKNSRHYMIYVLSVYPFIGCSDLKQIKVGVNLIINKIESKFDKTPITMVADRSSTSYKFEIPPAKIV